LNFFAKLKIRQKMSEEKKMEIDAETVRTLVQQNRELLVVVNRLLDRQDSAPRRGNREEKEEEKKSDSDQEESEEESESESESESEYESESEESESESEDESESE